MATDVALIEPILPPDVRRPARLTLLPSWVQRRCDILKKVSQPDQSGIHREVSVLPSHLMLAKEQKILIEQHVSALLDALAMKPCEDMRHGELTLTTVTKMTMVLPSKETGDLAGEAKGEAFMAALEDVPSWAVQEAMRKWHRSEYGPRHDYKWQPAPATLRELAMIETYRVMAVRRKLNDLLLAEPLLEFSPEREAEMKARIASYLTMNGANSPRREAAK
jgi:hypothetical protein